MAERTESANGHIYWVSGAFGQHFALRFPITAFSQDLCLIDFAHLYFLGLISLFLDIQRCPREQVGYAALPHHLTTPPRAGGSLLL